MLARTAATSASTIRAEPVIGQGFTEVHLRRPYWWLRIPGLIAFLAAWLFGGGFAAILLLAIGGEQPLFFVAWFLIWGLVGLIFLNGMIWRTFSFESLIARADSLTIARRLLFWHNRHELPAAGITEIDWVADDPAHRVTRNGTRIPQPAIRIVTADRQLTCARGIDESEARSAIAALMQRLAVARRRR